MDLLDRDPTQELYSALQSAFQWFNSALFDGKLPRCVLTLQRDKRFRGFYSPERFVDIDSNRTDEIALNPSWFAVLDVKVILSVLVHEMTHKYQAHFGKPGRRGYHNRDWAGEMLKRGLMPSDTGLPGGNFTGERMSHYVVPGGPFDVACDELLASDFGLVWFDRYPVPADQSGELIAIPPNEDLLRDGREGEVESGDQQVQPTESQLAREGAPAVQPAQRAASTPPVPLRENESTGASVRPRQAQRPARKDLESPVIAGGRVKYRCGMCKTNVWGKGGLKLICGECQGSYVQS